MKRITTSAVVIGPYSPAIVYKNLVFTSGQIPKQIDGHDIKSQTSQSLANLGEVLTAAGSNFASVLKTTVFLKDMNDFDAMNQVYASVFDEFNHRPARSAVQVARLPKDVLVEIECVAFVE